MESYDPSNFIFPILQNITDHFPPCFLYNITYNVCKYIHIICNSYNFLSRIVQYINCSKFIVLFYSILLSEHETDLTNLCCFCIDFVPNTSDDEGRYSIGAQANVGLFNLQKLLEALKPLLTSDQLSQ